jgi:hypothetical protein
MPEPDHLAAAQARWNSLAAESGVRIVAADEETLTAEDEDGATRCRSITGRSRRSTNRHLLRGRAETLEHRLRASPKHHPHRRRSTAGRRHMSRLGRSRTGTLNRPSDPCPGRPLAAPRSQSDPVMAADRESDSEVHVFRLRRVPKGERRVRERREGVPNRPPGVGRAAAARLLLWPNAPAASSRAEHRGTAFADLPEAAR